MANDTKRRGLRKQVVATIMICAALGVASVATPSYSAQRQVTTPGATATLPGQGFADLIASVEPSVVTIEVSKSAAAELSDFSGGPRTEEFFKRFFDRGGMNPSQPERVQGAGSGFIIDRDGYIVTNNHVIADADTVSVRLSDGRQYSAEIIGTDDKTDLALLKIDAEELLAITFGDSDATRVGDWVVAIGNPFGLGGTATAGIVSARGRDIRSGPYDDYLQIDAPINRGNSGGPVFNTDGEVVGVNTAIFSPNGGSVGIGFAIPSNQVNEIIAELKRDGSVNRGWLGVQIQDIDQDLSTGLGLESQDGALVADVVADSPAHRAGIEVGDAILVYNDHEVKNAKDLSKLVAASDNDDKVSLTIWRGDTLIDLAVVLGSPKTPTTIADADQTLDNLGIAVAPLTDELRRRLEVDPDTTGAVVTMVDPDSKAAEQGIRRGDILVQADRKPINSAQDLKDTIAEAGRSGRDSVPVLVKRGDTQRFAVLPVA